MSDNPNAGDVLGTSKFHLYSKYKGDLGVYDTRAEANQAAADHLYNNHSTLIADDKNNADVEITEVTHFGIPEAKQFEPKTKRLIEPGRLVSNLNV